MRAHPRKAYAIAVFAALLAVLPQVAWSSPLTIGSISTDPVGEVKTFQPFATYLAKQLGSEGVDGGKVLVAKSLPQMAGYLREGKVDLYIDSIFPSITASRLSGSKLLVRRWKKGVAEYHSVVFIRTDNGVNRPEDLMGKVVCFEEPFSTSGYMLPKALLMQQGLRLVPLKNPAERVSPGDVGYLFSNNDQNTMVWVVKGKVAAGAMDGSSFAKEAKDDLNSLKVLYKSPLVPRQVVSYRVDLSPKLVARIKEALIGMDQSAEGKKALQDFEKTTKFDELSEQAVSPLFKLQELVHQEFTGQ